MSFGILTMRLMSTEFDGIFPIFNGALNIEELLNWLSEVERVLDCMEVKEHQCLKLVVMRFKGSAVAWWDQTVANRARSLT